MKNFIEKTKWALLMLVGVIFIITGMVVGSYLMTTYSFGVSVLVSLVLGGIGGGLIGHSLMEMGVI